MSRSIFIFIFESFAHISVLPTCTHTTHVPSIRGSQEMVLDILELEFSDRESHLGPLEEQQVL